MKLSLVRFSLCALSIALGPRLCAADQATTDLATVRRLRAVTQGDKPGMAILIARDGKIVVQEGFGRADIAQKKPITVETKFRIGSITKQFTAAAVLRLSQQGKLALTDSLAKYFPKFPGGDKITLRHLLTHTSGIHSYTEKKDFLSRVTSPTTPAEAIAWFQDDPPDFAPGAGFHYDNSGYFLLGEIVAKVSGKSYGDFLRETFFEPLGMKDTGVYSNAVPPGDMAVGYSVTGGKVAPAMDWDMSWAGGAGALYSTVGDLFRWNEALFGGRVLDNAAFKLATTPVQLAPDAEGMRYGFGQLIFTLRGLPAIGHGGGLHGWLSELLRLPEQHCTVVVLSNAMPPLIGGGAREVMQDLVREFLADEIKQAPAPIEDTSVDPKTFPDYAGQYDYRTLILTVSTEGDALFAQLTGQRSYRLYSTAKDDFFVKEVDAELKFLRDEQGRVTSVRHSQNGNTFKAPRLKADSTHTPEQLQTFVGRYQYQSNVMTVTRDGLQLWAQIAGQPKFPIFAKSTAEFEWHVVPASVKFVAGEDGKVTKAVHTQNGQTFEAPKIE